jgi:hypothetical protein
MEELALVLDIDGTIIGNIAIQRLIYYICKIMKINYVPKRIPLRPYFKEFIKKYKDRENLHFYIYTGNESSWAEIVVSYIEKECDVKFERPILNKTIWTGNEYYKSLSFIKPIINKKIKGKYDILMIDNASFFHESDLSNVKLCPTYHTLVNIDISSIISKADYNKYYEEIYDILMMNLHCAPRSYSEFIEVCKSFNKRIPKSHNDVFWRDFSI